MAAYPSYPIGLESEIDPENGYSDDFDESGGHHSRSFHDQQYYRISLIHPGITLTQYNSLVTTYQAAPRAVFTLTYFNESPSVTYSVKFMMPPTIINNHGNDRCDVEVRLRGYKD